MIRFVKREPFGICLAVVLGTLWLRYGDPPLWTLPITLAVFVMAICADELWQAFLDAPEQSEAA
jgi:hypothetical protein